MIGDHESIQLIYESMQPSTKPFLITKPIDTEIMVNGAPVTVVGTVILTVEAVTDPGDNWHPPTTEIKNIALNDYHIECFNQHGERELISEQLISALQEHMYDIVTTEDISNVEPMARPDDM